MKKLRRSFTVVIVILAVYLVSYILNLILFNNTSFLTLSVLIPWIVLSVLLLMLFLHGDLSEKEK